jgi:hypothetical protein
MLVCDTKAYSFHLNETKMMILSGSEEVYDGFKKILDVLLLSSRKDFSSKILLFMKRLIEDLSVESPGREFLGNMFSHLLSSIDSKSRKVRKASIFLIRMVLESENFMSKDVLTKISERLFDRDKEVRKEAIRILSDSQNQDLGPKMKVVHVFKDLIRFDPSPEVRREVLKVIQINEITRNCIIERCIDSDLAARKVFYLSIFDKLKLSEINKDRRIFLMEKAYLEREFDVEGLFVDKIFDEYDPKENLNQVVKMFYNGKNTKTLEQFLFSIFDRIEYECGDLPELEVSSFILRTYLSFKDQRFGRDSLNLPDLSLFVSHIYTMCSDSIGVSSDQLDERMPIIKNLFATLRFYDFFTEESRKFIMSAIYKLLTKIGSETIIEECVILSKIACEDEFATFMGSIISKTMKNNMMESCMMICKYIMKYMSETPGEIHSAIINEVVLDNMDSDLKRHGLEILFFYCLTEMKDDYLKIIIESGNIEMCTDLYVNTGYTMIRDPLCRLLDDKIVDESEEIIFPISKLLLFEDRAENDKYLKYILTRYYVTEDDHVKQYCFVFFHEYFYKSSESLLRVFCEVLSSLESFKAVFIDQSLYWIANSTRKMGSQILFYNVCIYIIKRYDSIPINIFLNVLDRIEVMCLWDSNLTKKIIYCCGMIIKKIDGRSNVINGIIGRLMGIDDNEPIDKDSIQEVRNDLGM